MILTSKSKCWAKQSGKPSGPWFNIKMSSYQYRKSHCGDKTVVRSSYLHNGISYTGKMSSLYWIRAQVASGLVMAHVLGFLIVVWKKALVGVFLRALKCVAHIQRLVGDSRKAVSWHSQNTAELRQAWRLVCPGLVASLTVSRRSARVKG